MRRTIEEKRVNTSVDRDLESVQSQATNQNTQVHAQSTNEEVILEVYLETDMNRNLGDDQVHVHAPKGIVPGQTHNVDPNIKVRNQKDHAPGVDQVHLT